MTHNESLQERSRERLAVIVDRLGAGSSVKEIAEHLEVSKETVRWLASKFGVSINVKSREAQERRVIIKASYEAGVPLKEIARSVGMTYGSVKAIASQIGCTNTGEGISALRRGFAIPDHLQDDYQNLLRKGNFRSREAGQMLGLIGGAA